MSRDELIALAERVESGAIISDCGQYRYRLWRMWDHSSDALPICMLNPSTADASVDDPTIRRCMSFARREGFGGIVVVNLFALRATDPKALKHHPFPVGSDNRWHLEQVAWWCRNYDMPILCAWGAGRDARHALDAFAGVELVCLARTTDGSPRHPLYVRANQPLEPFNDVAVLRARAALETGK